MSAETVADPTTTYVTLCAVYIAVAVTAVHLRNRRNRKHSPTRG